MGRRSAASLAVINGSLDKRPDPPADLTAFQAEVWAATVSHEAADVFGTAALQQLLKEYCRHVQRADVLAKEIDEFDPAWLKTEDGLKRYEILSRSADRETKAIADKATKLRLTNQSRYTPKAAATAAKREGQAAKPWQFQG